MKKISFKECIHTYFRASKQFKKQKNCLSIEDQNIFTTRLQKLALAISAKDKKAASQETQQVSLLLSSHFPLSKAKKYLYKAAGIGIALFFAIIIRQSCFELHEIPSGSMRPTFREPDRLVVSKTQFGLNVPLMTKHFAFNPENVKRMGTCVFSADGLDTPGVNTTYFYLFPGVKRFVKRVVGLPGDRLYFYGGRIYGIDKEGKDISPLLQQDLLSHIEHIPFSHIDGKPQGLRDTPPHSTLGSTTILHNHQPIAHLEKKGRNVKGTMLHEHATDIHKLWGMGGFAMSKIVPVDALYFSKESVDLLMKYPTTKYFLQLTHHASIENGSNLLDCRLVKRPAPGTFVSYLPLDENSMKTIWKNLYTARFTSNKGYLESYGHRCLNKNDRPKIKGRPEDGTYEFLGGTPYQLQGQNAPTSLIPSLAIPKKLSEDHPFSQFSEEKCITFYNTGMDQSLYTSNSSHQGIAPCRYAYYRDGDMYLMGAKIFSKGSKALSSFVEMEAARKEKDPSYTPFVDEGAPLKEDGSIDQEKIKRYGLAIPSKHYYMLGDNHAQSGDSREFGFVPEDNLQGVTSFMIWAPDGRFGAPLQQAYSWYTSYKAFAWGLLFIGIGIYYTLERRKFLLIQKRTNAPLSPTRQSLKKLLSIILIPWRPWRG